MLLLLESIEQSATSTLGSLPLIAFLVGSLLEVAICFIVTMNEPVILAVVGAPIAVLALLGFLGAAFVRGITLALLSILLQDATSFHCISSFEVPFLLKGFREPLLLGSFLLSILRLKTIELVKESLIIDHAVIFVLLIELVLHRSWKAVANRNMKTLLNWPIV